MVVVSPGLRAREERALLGGTTTNCAGGRTPWGSWITCEESFSDGARPHGYVFEVQASADGPVRALPIRGAGRFVHEAVAWHGAALYETEDRGDASARAQAQAAGAAIFSRQEGAWAVGARRVYFDCTDGGEAEKGQIWELDPRRDRLRLVFESTGQGQLDAPDNLTLAPATGDVLVCEDGDGTQFVRGLTAAGRIYDLARSSANDTEFCGACFSPDGRVLFVNQQGAGRAIPAVTYAIWGPWARRVR